MSMNCKIKRTAAVLLTLAMMVGLCGCGTGSKRNVIAPWEPKGAQEKAAIEIVSGQGITGLAEFQVDKTYRSVRFGTDYYIGGKLVKEASHGSISFYDGENKKRLIPAWSDSVSRTVV